MRWTIGLRPDLNAYGCSGAQALRIIAPLERASNPWAAWISAAELDPSGVVQPVVYGAAQFHRMMELANGLALEVMDDAAGHRAHAGRLANRTVGSGRQVIVCALWRKPREGKQKLTQSAKRVRRSAA
jgi:hypothetical protein